MDGIQLGPLREEHAAGVCSLFRSLYGDGFPQKEVYDPGWVVESQRQGRQLTWVAHTDEGQVIGSISISRQAPFPDLYTLGHAMVLPEFRGRSLALQLTMLAATEVFQEADAVGGLTETGCHALKTQELVYKGGFRPTALFPDSLPGAALPLEHQSDGPTCALMSYFTIRDEAQRVYVPPHVREFCRTIYEILGVQRDLHEADGAPEATSEVSRSTTSDGVRLDVFQVGEDLADHLPEDGRFALATLPLHRPEAAFGVELLHQRGFRP
ncbi:MAG: GNAT family N-acetyltransferase, partial [Candidatus Eremiobacterota bacterium]